MPINPNEIKENADNLIIDPHFVIRLKKRNISLDEVKYQLKYKIPEILEVDTNKYKLLYQLEKGRYVGLYVTKVPKGLKMLTVFIEYRGIK